ncbi:MAG TPA: hypothetical protein VE467_02785 [Chryseolinea sp.]|nr:hypothetical protein [Chryseolinea sp.]
MIDKKIAGDLLTARICKYYNGKEKYELSSFNYLALKILERQWLQEKVMGLCGVFRR